MLSSPMCDLAPELDLRNPGGIYETPCIVASDQPISGSYSTVQVQYSICIYTCASAGIICPLNDTISCSAEIMPVITCSFVNCRRLMPSKHFFKYGCTHKGSFVSDRISSSSLFDRKKNL
jgi:hypothetical protein